MVKKSDVLHLYLLPNSKHEDWDILYNGDVIATGEGYELGQKIAQNYRDKYSPKSYIVTDPETVASMYELKKLMGKNTNDHDDYPVNISP